MVQKVMWLIKKYKKPNLNRITYWEFAINFLHEIGSYNCILKYNETYKCKQVPRLLPKSNRIEVLRSSLL